MTSVSLVGGARLAAAAMSARDSAQLDRAAKLARDASALTEDPRALAKLAWVRARLEFERGTPRHASEMVLAGVTTGRHEEFDWVFRGGVARLFPEQWERLLSSVPPDDRDGDILDAFDRMLNDVDPAVRERAVEAWCLWESATPGWPPTPELLAGPMICQNIEWFECPPPLLRTAVRMSSGTESSPRSRSSTDFAARSAWFASAAFTLLM